MDNEKLSSVIGLIAFSYLHRIVVMPCGSPSNAGRPSHGLWFKLWPDGNWEASPMTFFWEISKETLLQCVCHALTAPLDY